MQAYIQRKRKIKHRLRKYESANTIGIMTAHLHTIKAINRRKHFKTDLSLKLEHISFPVFISDCFTLKWSKRLQIKLLKKKKTTTKNNNSYSDQSKKCWQVKSNHRRNIPHHYFIQNIMHITTEHLNMTPGHVSLISFHIVHCLLI